MKQLELPAMPEKSVAPKSVSTADVVEEIVSLAVKAWWDSWNEARGDAMWARIRAEQREQGIIAPA